MLFKPQYVFNSISDVSVEFLNSKRIKGLLLDLDNTLTTHNNPIPPQSSLEWLDNMKKADIKLMIVSNNSAERVMPFAEQLGVDFVSRGKKPLPVGYNKACRRLGIEKTQLASVGDQIFTDVLGSNLAGIRSIFVFPIEPETSLPFRIKRFAERPFLPEKIGE